IDELPAECQTDRASAKPDRLSQPIENDLRTILFCGTINFDFIQSIVSSMFFDTAQIEVKAGDGGDGAVAFRREKYVPFGGPSGGDGGHGGSVILYVDAKVNTLSHFRHHHKFKADDGKDGRVKNQSGPAGADIWLAVPPGTIVRDATTHAVLGDLSEPKMELIVAKGGTPGKGNQHFATSTNQAPRMATNGLPGEIHTLELELKLIADVGLVGLPNAGKSTFLAATTSARPKIADYPFTTLEPNLGVVDLDTETSLVTADIPGLIEGASLGKGLGIEFLRHIERTRVLIHLLDGSQSDPMQDFHTINEELKAFGHGLIEKPQIVAYNKIDLPDAQAQWPRIHKELKKAGFEAMAISAVTHAGTREVLYRAAQLLRDLPIPQPVVVDEVPVIRTQDETSFVITRAPDASWHVTSKAVEKLALRHRFDSEESLMSFHKSITKLGVTDALRAAGVKEGDTVWIGEDYELEWQD
ncbi:MAG TPA: GTPase ObgE, partial [Anaerolineae bacterium]|nr:GTPase ObgE [Anaerolineae bacterium]